MAPVYAIQSTLVAVVTLVAILRYRIMRRQPGRLASRALFLTLVNLDVALILGLPAAYFPIYRLLGHTPGLPQLVQHLCALMMAFNTQILTLCLASPSDDADALVRGRSRRRVWLIIAAVALVVAYLAGPLHTGLPYISFAGERDPGVLAYVAVVQAYAALAVADIFRLCWRNRNSERRFLRLSLRFMAAGTAFGLLFSVHKLAYFAATTMGERLPWDESGRSGVQQLFLGPCLVLVAVALTLPYFGPRISRWRTRRRQYRRLLQLSSKLAVADSMPLRFGSLHSRLFRQVVTIRDALLGSVGRRLDPDLYALAHRRAVDSGLGADEAAVIAEAACIGGALDADAMPSAASGVHLKSDHVELDAEAEWLARVGDALAHSPLVGSAVSEYRGSRRDRIREP